MMEVDPQVVARRRSDVYMEELLLEPSHAEVVFTPEAACTPNARTVRMIFAKVTRVPERFANKKIPLLWDSESGEERCWQYRWPITLPFGRESLDLIMDKFCLSKRTPWLCITCTVYAQQHDIQGCSCQSRHIGFVMRRPNAGLFALDVAISVSHCLGSGSTTALILSTSNEHLKYLMAETIALEHVATNPLLLPTLISADIVNVLECFSCQRWSNYLNVELPSGRCGYGDPYGLLEKVRYPDVKDQRKVVLRILQQLTAYDYYFTECFLGIDTIRAAMAKTLSDAPAGTRKLLEATNAILDEELRWAYHKGKATHWEVQSLKERAKIEMDMTANIIAQTDSKINAEIGADSREIAAASKLDSTAMKGLAVVAMVFLPGTLVAHSEKYLQSILSMPFFSWPAAAEGHVVSNDFWIFWALTLPTTAAVVFLYAMWFSHATSQNEKVVEEARTRPSDLVRGTIVGV
ncbi:hypothetical protein QBC34DRAFT_497135 [Podospora aff. communis PSN243]|uniref:Uncharacterized protein n=1 Tax=Podospora aff. communis PSN243 TaxID=3040156 RepID=A0AAV9GDH3_9PEZI|nr:hypothetical protein QBC34DRAFT_497135 [Podospora aff. communis PSN243]